MTNLTLYPCTGSSGTLSTAAKLFSGTGAGSTTIATKIGSSPNNFSELYSKGTANSWAGLSSMGGPSGNGWLFDVTTLEGQNFQSGTWIFNVYGALDSNNDAAQIMCTTYANIYKRKSNGTYIALGSGTAGGSIFFGSSTSTYWQNVSFTLPTTAVGFLVGDKIYIDMWCYINGTFNSSLTSSTHIIMLAGNSSTQGTNAANSLNFISPGYQPNVTPYKFISARGKINSHPYKDISVRSKIRSSKYKDISTRGKIGGTQHWKDISVRGRINSIVRKDISVRSKLQTKGYHDISVRGSIAARNNQGGFGLYANGTGTIACDSFRVTQFPDPAMSFAPVLPRIGQSGVVFGSILAPNTTLGVDISFDGVNWTPVSNGQTIPGMTPQPQAVIDFFANNTSQSYLNTSILGGAFASWTYDYLNSRLIATGGTNALYLYTGFTASEIDFFVDMDQSDSGGLVWNFVDQSNFYYLVISDTLSSNNTPNTLMLYEVNAGVTTMHASVPIQYTVGADNSLYNVYFTRGTYRRFRVTMLQGTITAYVDGIVMLTYTDPSPIGAGYAGVFNNGGTIGSRYYQLWMDQLGTYVGGTPYGDIVTSKFMYTRQRLATTTANASPQVTDISTYALSPSIQNGITIPSITYNYSFMSKNFDELAKQSNFSWFFDMNRYFNFGGDGFSAAPWILQSNKYGLVMANDLEVNTDLELNVGNDLYRNRQIILGAQAEISLPPVSLIGDGSTKVFELAFPPAGIPTVALNGVQQTVGLKGQTGYEFYWAPNDMHVTQDLNGTALTSSDILIISYTGLYDVVVQVDDVAEQVRQATIENLGGTGIVEAVEDHTGQGMLVAQAQQLAQSLINVYAIAGRTLIFDTTRDGLSIGQTLTIFLPEHGIFEGQFFIQQIEIFLAKGTNNRQVWWYKVWASELPKKASWAKIIASGLNLSSDIPGQPL